MQKATVHNTWLDIDEDRLDARRYTDMIVVHHTGNPYDDDLSAEEINDSHQAQGWSCIGYHFVIRKDGTIEMGRPEWAIGAHAYGENSHTVGIHVCGNFELAEPTDAQIEALAMLIANLCAEYNIPVDADHVVGHRDLMATACPGYNLYSIMDTVRGKAVFYQNN